MNLQSKLDYWSQHTRSITRHDDENSAVRKAYLAKMRKILDEEEAAIDERDAARINELMGENETE
ncbi:hypothetical protein CPT_Seuss34 [Caulobacter phage Seuss]|uniref:Uncharacterized protein n=1 Tax=Caulobacter phage Seuss TaxID=1675601 RepID=A0A0K1LN47_9CAUD|nr:hypothetical protein HOR08_gp034 [Caulobacter phage Seuss]AKU43560.1 hypothetical protein CPT_Seuss34 [Caulobacter phage Seuss]